METEQLENGSSGNEAVLSFLRYYTEPAQQLDYAVLIKGAWGSGKTYLIKEFLKQREMEERKHLYVSLYGMTSFSQIEEDFYRQLHPVLSSKTAKIAGSILKGIAKTALKVDMNGDGKDDLTINSQIPDLSVKDFFSTPAETLLIFDDLERCSMSVTDVLGYINYFVEHNGFKVIIVANEDRIIQRENNSGKENDAYRDIKEKLIGQTLLVKPQLSEAFSHFLATIPEEKNRHFLSENATEIKNVFLQSGTHNLRALKRSLWNFTRVLNVLRDRYWEYPDAITSLMKTLLALSLEVKTGRLSADQLQSLRTNRFSRFFKKDGAPDTPSELLEKRYQSVVFDGTLPVEIIEDVVCCNGIVEREAIWHALDQVPPFADKGAEPAWIAAWRGYSRSDDEFEASVLNVEKEFKERKYEEPGDIIHVFGLRLNFAKIRAIPQSLEDVVSECKAYIDHLRNGKKLGKRVPHSIDDFSGWQGLGVSQSNTKELQRIFSYYVESIEKQTVELYPEYARHALSVAAKDPGEFFRLICRNNVQPSPYAEIPIFGSLRPEGFVEVLLNSSPSAQMDIMLAMKSRYDHGMLEHDLKDETGWIEGVIDLLNDKLPELRVNTRARIEQTTRSLEAVVRGTVEVADAGRPGEVSPLFADQHQT